jgi:DNA-binding response OmpR family regulator
VRVLIVEDEEGVRDVYRDFVAALGHEPVPVESAERGLAKLQRQQADAVLLDVRLPGMSGLEFLVDPAVRASEVPVVVVSGLATENEARACLQLGALDYLQKPVTLERLGAVLELLEPFAGARRRAQAPPSGERRPAPRAPAKMAVRLLSERGAASRGTCTQISASGMNVRTTTRFKAGSTLRVTFTPPDGGGPLEAVTLVIRVDKDGIALWFLDLVRSETRRLSSLVERLLLV